MPAHKKIHNTPKIDSAVVLGGAKKTRKELNLDKKTWAAQIKAAIEAGDVPEGDMFEGMSNEFDKIEWTWDEQL